MNNKNIIKFFVLIIFLGLLIGVAVRNSNNKISKDEVYRLEKEAVAEINTVSSNEVATVAAKTTEDTKEDPIEHRYVVYTLARVINPKDTSSDQKYRCIINKNEKGSYTGLVDIIVTADTLPELSEVTDKESVISNYEAEIKVNNAGEWLYVHDYYVIDFDSLDNSTSGIKEIKVKSIGHADDTYINEWKDGRALNSTFIKDMETIKKVEPVDVYRDICTNYQYTWTFEQLEAFKAYVESLDEDSKNKWLEAYNETDITLGY